MKTPMNLLAASAAALLLAACGKPAEPTPAPQEKTSSTEAAPAQPAAEVPPATETDEPKKLSVFCWSEYIPQSVIDEFSKETGIKVSVENYASNEEMLAKLMAGGGSYDIIQPSEYVIEALIKEKALDPIDKSKVPNLSNISPEFLNMPFDPGNQYSVPFMAGTVGIVVNTELITDPIVGYNDVFQDKYKGKIVVLDDAREIVSWGLETLNIPVNEVNAENLEKVKPVLQKWLPLVQVYDSDSPKTALLNGDVAIGIVWGGEGAKLLEESDKFKWIIPAEGTHLFVDNLAIPKGAKHPNNAMAFMNFILRPDISKKISDEFPYLNPNAAAKALLTEEQRNNPASFPTAEQLKNMQLFQDIGDQASQIDELVTTIKSQ
jgi:spermidine/putrescine transport system substrate-binding protein